MNMFNFLKNFKKKNDYGILANFLQKADKNCRIGIFSHENSDPDSVFSSFALMTALVQMGFNNVKIYLDQDACELIEAAGKFADASHVCYNRDDNLDITIALDLNVASRLGVYEKMAMQSKSILVIDHHTNPLIKCNAIVSKPLASSTGEVLFNLFKELKLDIDKSIATLLYVSIMADSQKLTVATYGGEVFDVVKELVAKNIDTAHALDSINRKLSVEELRAVAKAIKDIKVYKDITVATFDARKKDFAIDYNRIKDKSTWIFSSIKNLKVLLVLVVFEDKTNGSFRSYCEKDVNILAEKLGGGGHKKAAGFKTELPENYIMAIVNEFYD